jgi:hypothetical protein
MDDRIILLCMVALIFFVLIIAAALLRANSEFSHIKESMRVSLERSAPQHKTGEEE